MSPRESTPTPTPWTWRLSLPHSIAFDDDGKLYVADRSNKRIQIFTPDGDFLGQWTGMGGPNDITRGKDGNFYEGPRVCRLAAGGNRIRTLGPAEKEGPFRGPPHGFRTPSCARESHHRLVQDA